MTICLFGGAAHLFCGREMYLRAVADRIEDRRLQQRDGAQCRARAYGTRHRGAS